jgi:hypothetical protein
MNITHTQWTEIESKVRATKVAIESLQDTLITLAFEHNQQGNTTEGKFLMDLASTIEDKTSGKELCSYFYHPQPEWTGGDSSDPANTKYREPHIVGTFPKYIT